MAILKFEINTDDIFQNYDEEFGNTGSSFESLFKGAMFEEVKKYVVEKAMALPLKELTEKISSDVESLVESKLKNLINEDIAITDKWGKPTFVGKVEDYIKQQIDEKTLSPVDTNGRIITGACTSTKKTWIEWVIENEIRDSINKIKKEAQDAALRFCKETLDKELEKFKNATLSSEIMKRLEAVGIK